MYTDDEVLDDGGFCSMGEGGTERLKQREKELRSKRGEKSRIKEALEIRSKITKKTCTNAAVETSLNDGQHLWKDCGKVWTFSL